MRRGKWSKANGKNTALVKAELKKESAPRFESCFNVLFLHFLLEKVPFQAFASSFERHCIKSTSNLANNRINAIFSTANNPLY